VQHQKVLSFEQPAQARRHTASSRQGCYGTGHRRASIDHGNGGGFDKTTAVMNAVKCFTRSGWWFCGEGA
jgi:hypothetical protein